MSKLLQGFGTVLYDELEQIAIRRGGFASLEWTRHQITEAQTRIRTLAHDAADPAIPLETLIEHADRDGSHVDETLARAGRAVKAIKRYGEVVASRSEVATKVAATIREPEHDHPQSAGFGSIMATCQQFWNPPRPPDSREDWKTIQHQAQIKLCVLDRLLGRARATIQAIGVPAQLLQARAAAETFARMMKQAEQIENLDDLTALDRPLADAMLGALESRAGATLKDQTLKAELVRGAIVWQADQLAPILEQLATGGFDRVIAAYRRIRRVRRRVKRVLERLIDSQSVESRFEIGDIIADGARALSMRHGSVGLAFSGGGIRSATFNLGFFQGMAAHRLLDRFDYLSTVSGGGYIGAWLAAWVRREGGAAGEPQASDPQTIEQLARARIETWQESHPRSRGASTEADLVRGAAAAPMHADLPIESNAACAAAVRMKRSRITQALHNVETQLNSRRAVQEQATRRWVTPQEIRTGRESIQDQQPPLLKRVLEEEPEPVYHLRAFSNYLAPKLGLTSLDTWTMISVYLRNLFLNQFILLPMTLAVIAVPRLLLILAANLTPGPALGPVQRWLTVHPWLPSLGLGAVGLIAILTAPRMADFGAQAIGRRSRLDVRPLGRAIYWLAMPPGAIALWLITILVVRGVGPGVVLGARLPFNIGDWSVPGGMFLLLALAGYLGRQQGATTASRVLEWTSDRVRGWLLLVLAGLLLPSLGIWLPFAALAVLGRILGPLTGDGFVLIITLGMAWCGFYFTYRTTALIHASRQPVPADEVGKAGRIDPPEINLWSQILVPLTLVAFGVSLLFSNPVSPIFASLPRYLTSLPGMSGLRGSLVFFSVGFGTLVGVIRCSAVGLMNLWDHSRPWQASEQVERAAQAFVSGFLPGMALAAALDALHGRFQASPGELAAVMLTLGPLLVLIAMGAGSAIEVGLIGDRGDEDMREWRASLGAYLLMVGVGWTVFAGLSLYGPLLLWNAHSLVAPAAGAGWAIVSSMGALAGRSPRTDGAQGSRGLLEYVAIIAPPVFVVGLILAVGMLATAVQQVHLPPSSPQFWHDSLLLLADVRLLNTTWAILVVSAWVATIGCSYVNINLFSLNAFYANRLVRCYLGASRPREAARDGRSNFAPTNCPVPVRRPNPVTGFDPTDDFPLRDLAIVRDWNRDLVVDYPGPYHLINTAMNLVSGSELAWQERMAESFVLSPLYCGSKTTGYRTTSARRGDLSDGEIEPDERDLPDETKLPGFGGSIRLGTAISVSGAAASPNAGYHSSPLVTILLTVFNARLGLWFGNPARDSWRKSGPGFALYLFDELLGRTTDKGKYVYLSDGGHFENLGVYELIRRRCRFIVVCDAGADPGSSFWDLGGLVRKCREDFGVRIDLDVSAMLKPERTSHSGSHCVVGQIHYADVDDGAPPGLLLYVKPTLTGDEPSDVRNYVVDHPEFPHESTADQFFSESQFESYRVLGEHIATQVFDEPEVAAGLRLQGGAGGSARQG